MSAGAAGSEGQDPAYGRLSHESEEQDAACGWPFTGSEGQDCQWSRPWMVVGGWWWWMVAAAMRTPSDRGRPPDIPGLQSKLRPTQREGVNFQSPTANDQGNPAIRELEVGN